LKTQLLDKRVTPTPPTEQKIIYLSKIFPQINECIEEGELLEVLGRANAGKTTFMIECIKQAL
jgi:ABC-type multidrug transport system ATPase subunit